MVCDRLFDLSVTKIEQIYRCPSIVWMSFTISKKALLIVFTTNNWFFIYLLIYRIPGSLKWNCSILVTLIWFYKIIASIFEASDISLLSLHQQMPWYHAHVYSMLIDKSVIWNQCPGKTGCLGFRKDSFKSI